VQVRELGSVTRAHPLLARLAYAVRLYLHLAAGAISADVHVRDMPTLHALGCTVCRVLIPMLFVHVVGELCIGGKDRVAHGTDVLWHSSVVSSTSGVHRQPRVSRATATRGKLLLLAEPLDWILTSRHAARAQSATIALRAVILQVWIENERDLTHTCRPEECSVTNAMN
jgi:hypothetical protein